MWISRIAMWMVLCTVTVAAAPCQIILVSDPSGAAAGTQSTKAEDLPVILSDVIATGGRILSTSRVDLPLSTDEPILSMSTSDSKATFVLANDPRDWSNPLVHVDPDRLYFKKSPPAYDGIGKIYMGREISQVMGHLGAGWLERPEREQEERTDLLMKMMELDRDDVVADIGSGTGYFTLRIAPKVPDGKVVAVDIQPEMNAILEQNAEQQGISNVETVLGAIDDAKIPENSIDVVLFVDAYHEFSNPWEMKQSLYKALRPGGRVVLVEYRAEDPTVLIKQHHKMSEIQARHEFEAAGFRWVTTYDDLPQQHVLIFTKPGSQAEVAE